MERCFIVTEKSSLYADYFNWEENRKKVNEHVKAFKAEHDIKSHEYHASQDLFYIVPTKEDLEKFNNILTKDIGNGLRQFKQRSKIGKAWKKSLDDAGLRVLCKPIIGFYFKEVYGKHRTRLFDINGTVYCSIDPLYGDECPEDMKEIKVSEFYKVLEENAS